jgi:hypothetical protein
MTSSLSSARYASAEEDPMLKKDGASRSPRSGVRVDGIATMR